MRVCLFCRPVTGVLGLCLFTWGAFPGITRALNPDTPAGAYAIQGWYAEDGLPSSRVRSVRQSRDGYLWLATAQGIARLDGTRFTIYSAANDPVLTSSNFYEIDEGSEGALWFASAVGLYRRLDGRFTRFGTKEGLVSDYVRTVRVTKSGLLLVGTDRGISVLREGRILPTPAEWQVPTGAIRMFTELRDGSFMVGGREGLWRVVGGRTEKLSGTENFPDATYTAFAEEPDGRLWIASNRGLRCLHPDGRLEVFGSKQGLSSALVESLWRDRDGVLWIGTAGGLFRLAQGRVEYADYPAQFGVSLIGQMCETREGALWVGSNAGVFQLRETPARAVGLAQGLRQSVVVTMLDTQDGSWWIGLWSGGVYRYRDGHATPVPEFTQTAGAVYYTMCEDADGTFWIGGDSGLHRLQRGGWKNFYLGRREAEEWEKRLAKQPDLALPGTLHSRINTVIADGEGGHWIAASGGVYRHLPDDTFKMLPEISGQNVRAMLRARNGDLWLVIRNRGVLRRQNGTWTTFAAKEGLGLDTLRSVYEDSEGSVWVTSSTGASRFKGGQWRTYGAAHGLSDQINSVIDDGHGFVWLGTTKGVVRTAQGTFDEIDAGRATTVIGQTITRRDGMPDSECTENGSPNAWATRGGLLLFPTNSGLAVIDPRGVKFNPVPPPVQIEGIAVGGVAQDRSAPLVFPPGSRDIEIRFSGASMLVPERVRFKVKLAPLDTDWIDLGGRRDVRFPRLPPGGYEFHVIACNNDGVWNEEGAALQFTVRPFFYQTKWFLALGLVSLGGATAGGIRWRYRRVRLRAAQLQVQNAELERRVAERTAELAKSYETLRASEYFYHSLVESLPQIIVRKDANGVFTYANSAFAEMHQRSLAEIIGRTDRDLVSPEQAERARADDLRIMQTRQPIETEAVIERDGRKRYLHVKKVPLYNEQSQPIGVQVLFWDMTVFRETEEQLRQAQRDLIETSRLAGMAEVASGVLHNVGNVLNSVNTSAAVIGDKLRQQRLPSLAKVAQLLVDQGERIGEFFATDPRARKLPAYLTQLSDHLQRERDAALQELGGLAGNIDHIKEIVAAQQSYARVSGVTEVIAPAELIEMAIGIAGSSLARHGVDVVREFLPVPPVSIERQKTLQILVNLVRNAKEAIVEHDGPERRLTLGLRPAGGTMIEVTVTDTGMGIAPENLERIFGFGFTTKKQGHGFGLHSSALAARELGGSITVESAGLGRGATFILRLPVAPMSAEPTANASVATDAPDDSASR